MSDRFPIARTLRQCISMKIQGRKTYFFGEIQRNFAQLFPLIPLTIQLLLLEHPQHHLKDIFHVPRYPFWRVSVRCTLSCTAVPEENLPMLGVKRWKLRRCGRGRGSEGGHR